MSSIWIDKKDKFKLIEDVVKYDELDCEALYEGCDIDEFYIDKETGDLEGFISIGPIGVGFGIPFDLWFSNFVKYKSFEDLEYFLFKNEDKVKGALTAVKNMRSLIQSCKESVNDDI